MTLARGIHVRYLGDEIYPVEALKSVFQKGTIAFAPREIALVLLKTGLFEAVAGGPTAQAFIVRVAHEPGEIESSAHALAADPAQFELDLEEEERRLEAEAKAAADTDPPAR